MGVATISTTGSNSSKTGVEGRFAAIVTSRLRRLVLPDEPWLAGLRAAVRAVQNSGNRLIVGAATAGCDLVRHAAIKLGIPHEIVIPPTETFATHNRFPRQDRAIIETADTVYVLSLRTGGNVHGLLQERLQQRRGGVVLIALPGLQSEATRTELCHAGATLWQPSDADRSRFDMTSLAADDLNVRSEQTYCIHAFPDPTDWSYLTHTTRSCPGPWPGQSQDEYFDHLLESHPQADHSSRGTLQRIVDQRRLIASGRTIRGGHKVISFTACPLPDLPALHCFRPHRLHWDFEPYGVCIRRDWLINHGARPVIYGNEDDWQILAEPDRPFFQLASGESGTDWTVEREWRHVGDLDLSSLTADDVLLFVPGFESAKSLAHRSGWPITILSGQ